MTHTQETSIPCAHPEDISKKSENIDSLTFVRLKIPRLIPGILIENVKGRTFTPEQFYKYQESQVDNPFNYLYALVDEVKKIHGYIWVESNALDGSMFVNTYSVSKEFWGKGKAIPKAIEFLGNLKEKIKAPRCYWITTNEKFFSKNGFKKSKQILMEYNEDQNK